MLALHSPRQTFPGRPHLELLLATALDALQSTVLSPTAPISSHPSADLFCCFNLWKSKRSAENQGQAPSSHERLKQLLGLAWLAEGFKTSLLFTTPTFLKFFFLFKCNLRILLLYTLPGLTHLDNWLMWSFPHFLLVMK